MPDSTPAPAEWCPGPDAYDEIKTELLGLSYAEDLQLMAEFGSAVLAARNGTVPEIEVTSEMIEVGVEVIALNWPELAAPDRPRLFEEIAREVFEAMSRSRATKLSKYP